MILVIGLMVMAEVTTAAPTSPPSLEIVGKWEELANSPDAAAALTACTSLIEINKYIPDLDLAAVYYDRGNAEVKLGRQDAAYNDFTEAVTLKPDFDLALHNRAMINDDRGNYDLAIRDFSAAIAAAPSVRGHYYNRARTYMHLGNYRLAALDYSDAMKLWPDFYGTYAGRCRALAAQGDDLVYARADCERAVESDSDNSMFLTLRAFVKLKQNDFYGVIADANAALINSAQRWTEAPKFQIAETQPADALYLKGIAELRFGRLELGEKDLAATKQKKPIVSDQYRKMGIGIP